MNKPVSYRKIKKGDEFKIFNLIESVFNQFVAPEYSQEGIDEFMKYIQPDALLERLTTNHFGIVALVDSQIIGSIMIRDFNHIALLFVDSLHQQKGVGKELFERALQVCAEHKSKPFSITVNSSPNSVDAYRHLGFEPTKPEQCVNGIRFVPMFVDS